MRKRPRKKYKAPASVGRPIKKVVHKKDAHKRIDKIECMDIESALKKLALICGINYKRLARMIIYGVLSNPENIPGIDVMMKTLRRIEK